MRRMIEFKGFKFDVNREIEKIRPKAEKAGIDLDSLPDEEALFVAARLEGVSIPVLIGIEN